MIDLSNFKQLVIDGKKIVQLFIDDILVWRAYKNWVRYSINTDGSIFNGGLGYKDGYRVRSGGTEQAQSHGACTGFIPVSPGDIIRFSGWGFWGDENKSSANTFNVADSSFTNLGQNASNSSWGYGIFASGEPYYDDYGFYSVVEEKTGIWKWIVPPVESGVAYIRVSGNDPANANVGERMIVTINEEII